MDKDLEMYKNAITKHLKYKHNLSNEEIEKLIIEYNIDEIAKNSPNHFYYESPQYWAEFLIS